MNPVNGIGALLKAGVTVVAAFALVVAANIILADEPDSDGDGWTDAQELRLGTASNLWCPREVGADHHRVPLNPFTLEGWNMGAWPPDFSNNGIVNGQDLLYFNRWLSVTSDMPDGKLKVPIVRLDLSGNGVINGQDMLYLNKDMSKRCEQ